MQNSLDRVFATCDNFRLAISSKKTEFIFQPKLGSLSFELQTIVKGQCLNVVDKFTYPGSTLLWTVQLDNEVTIALQRPLLPMVGLLSTPS